MQIENLSSEKAKRIIFSNLEEINPAIFDKLKKTSKNKLAFLIRLQRNWCARNTQIYGHDSDIMIENYFILYALSCLYIMYGKRTMNEEALSKFKLACSNLFFLKGKSFLNELKGK